MKELAHQDQQSNSNMAMYDPNDSFAQVMGKDKEWTLGMYGLGVTSNDIYGKKPSRATLLR